MQSTIKENSSNKHLPPSSAHYELSERGFRMKYILFETWLMLINLILSLLVRSSQLFWSKLYRGDLIN